MSIFEKLFGGESKSKIFTNEEIANAGACPNCWGKQEYDNVFQDKLIDKDKPKAFIAQFVQDNLTGIKLEKVDDVYTCPACKVKYKID